ATQSIVFIGVNTALLWYHSDWRPTWHIDFGPMKRMFGFSVKILVSAIATQINSNVMNILLGRYYRAQTVGYYNQGYQ
ncbi:lipopolysaccharide biosynthesis protein, partial [Klebsiella pneumoniae]|nr:lipopolysaccharide biosynthesis protein [Klebsiella pneumoniae]